MNVHQSGRPRRPAEGGEKRLKARAFVRPTATLASMTPEAEGPTGGGRSARGGPRRADDEEEARVETESRRSDADDEDEDGEGQIAYRGSSKTFFTTSIRGRRSASDSRSSQTTAARYPTGFDPTSGTMKRRLDQACGFGSGSGIAGGRGFGDHPTPSVAGRAHSTGPVQRWRMT